MKLLVSLGECMVELISVADELWRLGIAGDTLNTAWYARALLPADWSVAYATVIGRDMFSEKVPTFLAKAGIMTDRLARHETRSIGLYAVSLTNGERSFSYWREHSAARTLADDPIRLAGLIEAAAVLHVSGITLAILSPQARRAMFSVIAAARGAGMRVAFDPNIRLKLWESDAAARQAITEMAGLADITLPSFDDEASLFCDANPAATCARYEAAGTPMVVVKNAGGAIEIADAGKHYRIEGLPRVVPVDTTGAGDSFNGAFLAGLLMGQNPEQAVRRAHEVATCVVGYPGALLPFEVLNASIPAIKNDQAL